MVEVFEQDIRTSDRQSSKGNQLKWKSGENWYKADYTGYEGLAEYMVSHLLQKSTLSREEYVSYDLEEIKYKSNIYRGVKSRDFLTGDWQIITLERLFQSFFGESLYRAIFRISDVEVRYLFLIQQVERITGLVDFGKYVNKLFTIDAFFLNEDRHMHNIAVLMNGKGEFAYCPIFDNGAALLADTTMDYPLEGEVYELIDSVRSKSIDGDFDEQLTVSERCSGCHLKFHFTKRDVSELLEKAVIYPTEVRERVGKVLFEQIRKYQYLFV